MATEQKFNSLVDAGHQVSMSSLSSLLDADSIEVNMKYQVPWSRNLFIIVYNKTSAVVFDAEAGKDTSRIGSSEKPIDMVLFDNKNTKVGFVNKEHGTLKLFSLTENQLKFESDFTCDKLKKNDEDELIPQIYGDNIIVKAGYTQLVWYSLSTGKQVKEVPLPGDDGVFVVPSQVEPVIYTSATIEDMYAIHVVDCLLKDDEVIKEKYGGSLNIEMDNCGDGVDGLKLIETEHGSVLNIYFLGTGDRGFKAIDLKTEKTVMSAYFDNEIYGYNTIECNPGSNFYSIQRNENQVAIMHAEEDYEDEKVYEDKAKEVNGDAKDPEDDENEDEEDEDEGEDPTEGAYFKFMRHVDQTKWLNKDVFTVKLITGEQPRQVFFSIAKRNVIGSIDDDINEVFIAGNKIVAFAATGDIYCVVLNMDSSNDAKETQPSDKPTTRVEQDGLNGDASNHAKKRKSSEMESDEDIAEELEAVPKKKQKVLA